MVGIPVKMLMKMLIFLLVSGDVLPRAPPSLPLSKVLLLDPPRLMWRWRVKRRKVSYGRGRRVKETDAYGEVEWELAILKFPEDEACHMAWSPLNQWVDREAECGRGQKSAFECLYSDQIIDYHYFTTFRTKELFQLVRHVA